MNANPRTRITLIAGLLLGAALGLTGPQGKPPASDTSSISAKASAAAANAGSTPSRAGLESSSARTAEVSKSAVYAAAWELLQQRDLRREERQDLESRLLGEWSKVDLRAALHAALEAYPTTDSDPFETPFGTCWQEIPLQLDLVWELVASREYGLHTRALRKAWISASAEKRPLDVLRRLPDLPSDVRALAVHAAIYYTHHRQFAAPGKDEVVAAVLALRGTPDETAALEGFATGIASTVDFTELGTLLLDPPDPDLRDLYVMAYAVGIADSTSPNSNPHLDSLPPDLRAEVEAAMKVRREKQ
jgi:hypothetical protein